MKSLIIFISIFGASNAGVGIVTPAIEEEALRLWQRFCGDYNSPGGVEGNSLIYCKREGNKYTENFSHSFNLRPRNANQDQVVFVQPPTYHYKHDVVVSGGARTGPRTVIYVKPQQNTHEVNLNDQTVPGTTQQKPTLYFLRGQHQQQQDEPLNGYNAPVQTPAYLPPAPINGNYGSRTTQPPTLSGYGYRNQAGN